MSLSAQAVKRPIATTMLLAAAVLLGIVSLTRLDLDLLPAMQSRDLTVWIPFPDAGVLEIEEVVSRRAEETVITVRGVQNIRTTVVPGGTSVNVELTPGADPDLVALGIRERLDALRWELPDGVERPMLLGSSGHGRPFIVLALGADDLPAAADWARLVLRPRLEQAKGVARAQVIGAPEPEIRVQPDPEKMQVLGIDSADIAASLRAANVDATGGYLRRRGVRYALHLRSRLVDADDVGDVVVARRGNYLVHLRDIAEIVDGFADPEGFSRLDGEPAVGILVHREAGANPLSTAERLHAQLRQIESEHSDVRIAVVNDPSPFVRQAIQGVWQAVWLGGLLAFGVLLLFLRDLRSPLYLVTALPVSIVTSFSLLELFDVSLNLMSLGGMALGVGMLVDNSIICLENIHRLRAGGAPPHRAAARGAREVALPMLASTLTTCAVFLPLAWVPGNLGALFRDQAIAVSVSLCVSLVVALTLLPMLAAWLGTPLVRSGSRPLFGTYERALSRALRHRAAILGSAALLLCVSVLLLLRMPREILPDVASEGVEVSIRLPSGGDISVTDQAARRIEVWLQERSEVEHVFASVGNSGSLDPADAERRVNRAILRVLLHSDALAHRRALLDALQREFAAEARWNLAIESDRSELEALLPRGDATLRCEIAGPDPVRAQELAVAVRDAAQQRVRLAEHPLRLLRSETEPRYRMRPRRDEMWRYGLSEEVVTSAVRTRTSGLEATSLRRFDQEVPVVLRHDRDAEASDPAAGNLVAAGRTFPVRQLFDVQTEIVPARILRENQVRIAAVRWDGPLRDVGRVKGALESALAEVGLPPGYTSRFTGAHQEMRTQLTAVLRAFALSAGLVLLVLAAQFESLRLPIVIFAAVPLALAGVAAALLLSGSSLNVLSGIGLVVLVGIVVNDSILKVDLLRRLRADGVDLVAAIHTASRRRYRPILMTTATTVLGLVPLFFGRGAELRGPMAAALIGGLLSSTLLTLFVIPLLFHVVAGAPGRTRGESVSAASSSPKAREV
ncbi:MAG: efflux RND transporter permease subunit [Candidatus Latescibacterota bacterium]|nr:MAG: efflux RND transporter permease subunit [Candidatus Latescibacterota bacterium]